MALPTAVPKVARKTVTHIYNGFVYKERFMLPGAVPANSSARLIFVDSAGTSIAQISTNISGNKVEFSVTSDLSIIPDGAGFYCYVHLGNESSGKEHLVAYGTAFVR